MNRRHFLSRSAQAAAIAALSSTPFAAVLKAQANPAFAPFSRPLYIPPILEPIAGNGGAPIRTLTAVTGAHSFFPGLQTPTMAFNGPFLGPTIRVRNGEEVAFDVHNELDQVTTVHWHGLHVPARWDGGPHQPIQPGDIWRPRFTIKQQAATLWYHPHAMGLTGEHVYNGMAGLFIIDDDTADALPLPQEYGVDDIPLIIQDRRFYEDGSFAYVRAMHDVMHGVIGNNLIINGMIKPYIELTRPLVRFRILNGSNSSIYRLRLSSGNRMQVIASDGGLLAAPVPLTELIMTAGERYEILVDCTAQPKDTSLHLLVDQYSGNSYEALEIRYTGNINKRPAMPGKLRPHTPPAESSADNTRTIVMETMSRGNGGGMERGMMGGNRLTINGRHMDMARIDERIKLGSTEIWEIVNDSASRMQLPHSMHLHDVQFHILDRNGEPPEPFEAGRKDTVLLWPGERVRIIASFLDYTGIYMFHCHMLEHEDAGMMGQFEVYRDSDTI
ncbi:MAG: multicopper oxidase domain-containing protein [Desulfofustis sp. PB-SRB1]|mgnify:CR=1 FL=1|jgi:blue copper oxidase|nr:multicopper oxidase domain-containing protein [Desulfofustis sp. PB-SRB1]MBM1003909.1 multicopper oxidase domain-containing protein [Desulfofustis sp. PB-SRB1]